MGKKKAPKHAPYEEFKDTPWITQGREIADIGGQGILDNWNSVNVFDDAERKSMEKLNEDVYKRAFGDMERQYMNTMNKYNTANYNRFGTLNATAPYYITDQYQRDFQRQMNDLAYNKAVNYEDLVDRELQRRYNTLNMFGNLYQYGVTPHNVDISNWNTRNTNKDIAYANAMSNFQNQSGGILGGIKGLANGAITGAATGGIPGAIAGGVLGGVGGFL